jgi:hypothetical protein
MFACPQCGRRVGPPYERLASRRVNLPDMLPGGLRAFYAEHEGRGYHEMADLQMARLDELETIPGSRMASKIHPDPIWDGFEGIMFAGDGAMSVVMYVASACFAPVGSIVATGTDVWGPAGLVKDDLHHVLIVDRDLPSWLERIEADDWIEYAFTDPRWKRAPENRRPSLRRHFASLNPNCRWAATE